MLLSEFDYNLPKELIAQKPAEPRDSSKLLVINKDSGQFLHKRFKDIGNFFKKGDVIVLNCSKVLPARLIGNKVGTNGVAEILLLNPIVKKSGDFVWSSQWKIIGKPRLALGQKIDFAKKFQGEIIKNLGYEKIIEFNQQGEALRKVIFACGYTPVPPYIHSELSEKTLRQKYQTVYAEKFGSVAAPTAGFHFTKRLISSLKKKGVIFKEITLHVGLGTFQPINTENVQDHQMAGEWAMVDPKTADFLNQAKAKGQRIITVGTTATRTLESFTGNGKLKAGEKVVDIFIYPSYQFKFVDGLITNFHLPKSTPLLLVSAFSNKELILKAYQEAIKKHYRFYSFGDAMLII
ncbi:MAG: tRNA preQ1(34) S-adenosylmethionine ribosyltransferase-isomerase QueA [Candidatus Gribaldobacteria bacterium]|nr:tRNA preQ1(34) S-adenosylmethionine ribosyltransferase-isomerase QueA [Candidatus Gribaldobacteria bacterium]